MIMFMVLGGIHILPPMADGLVLVVGCLYLMDNIIFVIDRFIWVLTNLPRVFMQKLERVGSVQNVDAFILPG